MHAYNEGTFAYNQPGTFRQCKGTIYSLSDDSDSWLIHCGWTNAGEMKLHKVRKSDSILDDILSCNESNRVSRHGYACHGGTADAYDPIKAEEQLAAQ